MGPETARWKEIRESLPDDHLAKMVERYVERLDRTEIDQAYGGKGSPPFDPVALMKMVIFQYLKGNQSPATWHEEARRNEAMQWLGRGYQPARRTWYDFRDRAAKFIEQVHQQVVSMALDLGIDPSLCVQDGTSVAACASRHRMVNRSTLDKRIEVLESVAQGECTDEVPRWVPPTAAGREDLAARMDKASDILDERIEKNAKKPSDKRQAPEKIRVSLSDPIAPLGRDKLKVYRPLYTVQYVVAAFCRIILAYCCEPRATDAGTLAPMIDKTQEVVGGRLETMLADAAYCSILDLQDCRERGVDLIAPMQSNRSTEAKKQAKTNQQISRDEFIWNEAERCYQCPEGHRLNYVDRERKRRHSGRQLWQYRFRCDPAHCGPCPLADRCLRAGAKCRTIKRLEGQEWMDAHQAKMAEPEVQDRYRLRGQTVELTYAESKGNRRLQRFHGRGLTRARTETGLMVVAQNLIRLHRLEEDRLKPPDGTT